jgi:aminopeptidase N
MTAFPPKDPERIRGFPMKSRIVGLLLIFFVAPCVFAGFPKGYPEIDLIHAFYCVALYDTTDRIEVRAVLSIAFRKDGIREFRLDLSSCPDTAGFRTGTPDSAQTDSIVRGMHVSGILENDTTVAFSHEGEGLVIHPNTPPKTGEIRTYTIRYAGIPGQGLVIGKNLFGERSFFGDNWPRGLHHWLPCVDHPSDKYTCEFDIEAPSAYQVVAGGRLIEETNLSGHRTLTRWTSSVPLASKVMSMGVARFAVEHLQAVRLIPVETWVYPQNREEGFQAFAQAVDILAFYDNLIGPFPFEKLANVQSATVWGGFEGAGAILYNQNAFSEKWDTGRLLAHEIAHQWFGDAVTESDWSDIWISEGFATYLEALWTEANSGPEAFRKTMSLARDTVVSFVTKHPESPVIDTTVTNPGALLNVNSYEKGAWVLHMLRTMVGDTAFFKGLRTAYDRYQHKNMSTAQFQSVMESVTGEDLGWFFRQWLYEPGIPALSTFWKYDRKAGVVEFSITQVQSGGRVFRIPLECELRFQPPTPPQRMVLDIRKKYSIFRERVKQKPIEIILDPGIRTLFAIDGKNRNQKETQ